MINILFALLASSISPSNTNSEFRTQTYCIDDYQDVTDADTSRGQQGVMMSGTIGDNGHHVIHTSSVAPPVYPSKLQVYISDGSSDSGTVTCTSLYIVGTNQFGFVQSETIVGLTEAAQNTALVYERVTLASATGCFATGVFDAERVIVRTGNIVGLPMRLTNSTALINICILDASTSSGTWDCMFPSSADGTLTVDASGASNRVDVKNHAIDLSGNVIRNSAPIDDDDRICIRFRAPAGRQ